MFSFSQIIFIVKSKKTELISERKKSKEDHPFLGIAARRVYMRAIELNPLTSPDLRRFPLLTSPAKEDSQISTQILGKRNCIVYKTK